MKRVVLTIQGYVARESPDEFVTLTPGTGSAFHAVWRLTDDRLQLDLSALSSRDYEVHPVELRVGDLEPGQLFRVDVPDSDPRRHALYVRQEGPGFRMVHGPDEVSRMAIKCDQIVIPVRMEDES